MDEMLNIYHRIRGNQERKKDPVGALLELDYF